MSCPACKLKEGALITLDTHYPVCTKCNSNCSEFYPRDAQYVGKIENVHWFKLDEPYRCPVCNVRIKGGYFDCGAEGTLLNVNSLRM